MTIIKEVRGFMPSFGKNCFLAENAVVIGDVVLGDDCTVWFNAVVRGDVNSIRIGHRTNIQDGAIIHATYEQASTQIGSKVSIAHNAIVHGCIIEDRVLVGMGAVIMDHAFVETGSVIAAGAIVLPNTRVRAGKVYAGVPAREVKDVSADLESVFDRTADNYVMYAEWYK